MNDKRKKERLVVYGACCVWWDYIENANSVSMPGGHNLPCCPHCKSVLYEVAESKWWKGVAEYEKKEPGYTNFVKWLKGKCFKTISEARMHQAIEIQQLKEADSDRRK